MCLEHYQKKLLAGPRQRRRVNHRVPCITQAPVVLSVDNATHWINLYAVDSTIVSRIPIHPPMAFRVFIASNNTA